MRSSDSQKMQNSAMNRISLVFFFHAVFHENLQNSVTVTYFLRIFPICSMIYIENKSIVVYNLTFRVRW